MKVLIVDMTHGGIKIALEFLKKDLDKVYAYDIYKTLKKEDINVLTKKGLIFVDKIPDEEDLLVVAPVHSTVEEKNQITHHEAVKLLLSTRIKVPVIEVTGVKGKTSVVWMLKEIFKEQNPLVLSSLGIEALIDDKTHLLVNNISITPANIIKACKLAENFEIGIFILETSLGGTGLADVGILTNLAEDYSIASGTKTASMAKSQIFNSKMVACDYDAFKSKYSRFSQKTITFGYKDDLTKVDVGASNVNFGLDNTHFKAVINNLKTINGRLLNTEFDVSTFAPAEHHLNNVLSAVCASLILEVPIKTIQRGLKNYRGIKGRTSIKKIGKITIIEEINPGINVKAVEKSFEMISPYKDCAVILGGRYGITCEEINEEMAADFLDNTPKNIKLILTDDLGRSIKSKINRNAEYHRNIDDALESAMASGSKTILLIYRSNFADINMR